MLNGAVKMSIPMEEEVVDQAILVMETETLQIVAKDSPEEYAARQIMSAPLKLVSFLENLKPNQLDMTGQLVNPMFG